MKRQVLMPSLTAAGVALLLTGCGGGNAPIVATDAPTGGGTTNTTPTTTATALPQLSAATGASLQSCTDLGTKIAFANTTITAATSVAAGTLVVAGTAIPAHCLVTGSMYQRVGPIDGVTYAIGFEMRLPQAWNGRFFYQANGGLDGSVVTATGGSALQSGFAVISSDAGHSGASGPAFGIDPQARLDYGYQAVGKLTPMAKEVIRTAYGKKPDRSYIGGCSNGGRHTMVAASRYADQYDGFLAGDPGFRLPFAAVANIAAGKGYASVATDPANLQTGYTAAEQSMVAAAVLGQCDALDGSADGLVQDTAACQTAFNLDRDVPTCTGARTGSCLTAAQKTVIGKRFAGLTTSTGAKIYSSFPFDGGIGSGNTAFWNFTSPVLLDSGSVGEVFQSPPENSATFVGPVFAMTGNIDTMFSRIQATTSTYTENSISFMTPPNPGDLSALKGRGAKMMVYHGTSDPIFSSDDTTAWYDTLRSANGGDAGNFARFYRVPGMTHCSGGIATDQFDMLPALVDWVEKGVAPESVVASARGAGNPAGANTDLPASWSATRSRPLCTYPKVARYKGSGSIESADSFSCK